MSDFKVGDKVKNRVSGEHGFVTCLTLSSTYIYVNGDKWHKPYWELVKAPVQEDQWDTRALATPDQTSALERVKAEAKAEGMRTAARITRVEAERLSISLHDAALRCEAAILAAIPKLEGV